MNEKTIKKAEELGYEVALTNDAPAVYFVKGFGVETYYTAEQEDAWTFLVDEAAHEHRVNMYKHNDEEDEFTMDDDAIFESSMKASISVGLIEKDRVDEMREARKVV